MNHDMKVRFFMTISFAVIIMFTDSSSSKKSTVKIMNAGENEVVNIFGTNPDSFKEVKQLRAPAGSNNENFPAPR